MRSEIWRLKWYNDLSENYILMEIKKITTENERFSMFLSSFPAIRGFYDDLSGITT